MRTTTEKRTKKVTINLTPNEWELVQAIADQNERNTSEQARLLLLKMARTEWAKISNLNPTEELHPIKAD